MAKAKDCLKVTGEVKPQIDEKGDRLDPLTINGITWTPIPGVIYPHDYHAIVDIIRDSDRPGWTELNYYRNLIQRDLFFILYFVMKIPGANHPFVIRACDEVQNGPKTMTLDVWGREHYKSTILTVAESIQKLAVNREERIGIFSFTRANATAFLLSIKMILEQSDLLKACFPDVFYQKPETEAFKWNEEVGLFVKRDSVAKEASVSAWGLTDGMPTGKHFTHRIYDDVETLEFTRTPDLIEKTIESFHMSQFLGSDGDTQRVIGTFYHHLGPLVHIMNMKGLTGESIYQTRIKPGTVGGEPNGESVLLSKEKMDQYRANPKTFHTQILCNPTPKGTAKLNFDHIKVIEPGQLPSKLYKFMAIDPAGIRKSDNRQGDSWAIFTVGVEPYRDDIGLSNVYILDACIQPMDEITAMTSVVDMYCRAGRVLQLGIEKVGMSTMEIHITNALRAKGKWVSIESGNLVILKPAGRDKAVRIEKALDWPLKNGKIHLVSSIPNAYRDRIRHEMDRFPVWHDDGLDALSYVYDMLRDYKFPAYGSLSDESDKEDAWERAFRRRMEARASQYSWMGI